MQQFNEFLSHFKKGKYSNYNCPAHDDMEESLSINQEDDKILIYCHALCETKDILAKVGLTMADLFLNGNNGKNNKPKPALIETRTHVYHNKDGKQIYRKIIYKYSDDSKTALFERYENGKWIKKLENVKQTLYNIHLLKDYQEMIIVEGEKDVENLEAIGMKATTSGGAGTWKDEYAQEFIGKDMVIIQDNDKPGGTYAIKVANSLQGIANSVKIVALPNLPEGGDISDWIDNMDAKTGEEIREALQTLVNNTAVYAKQVETKPTAEVKTKKEQNQSEKLLKIAAALILFTDQYKEPYAVFNGEATTLKSKAIKEWLSYEYYKKYNKAPNSDAINQALEVLKGKARFESPEMELQVRIVKKDDVIHYSLGKGKAVKITDKGWEVIDAPIVFKKYSHQKVQVTPEKGGKIEDILKYININKSDKLLFIVTLISYFIPDIPHPVLDISGSQGVGKSTVSKIIKAIIDPSETDKLYTPKDPAQIIQILSHHYLAAFDNISHLQSEVSDILCTVVTGGAFSKRELYSDDEDVIYRFLRCIVLNGINTIATKPDLLDRSILLRLERIDPKQVKQEALFLKEFESNLPTIMGAIFTILSKAIVLYSKIELNSLPRMADYFHWGWAIAEALGGKGLQFETDYLNSIKERNEEVIHGNTLAQAVIKFMNNNKGQLGSLDDVVIWNGYMKDAYTELSTAAGDIKNDKSFPAATNKLKRALERIKTNLADVGITYKIDKNNGEGIPITFTMPSKE